MKNSGYENSLKKIETSLNFGGYSIFSAVLILSGTILIPQDKNLHFLDIPTISFVFWVIGFSLFFRGVAQNKKWFLYTVGPKCKKSFEIKTLFAESTN